MRSWRLRFVVAGAALVGCTAASAARAEDAPVAQALFDQAKKAMAAHDYAQACPKLEESYKLQEALGTLLNLAVCYEAEGRLASAWTTFLEVATKARAAGQTERAKIGKDRAAALAPKLSNLAIDVPNEARLPGLEIRRDGNTVGPAEWGTPLPADPGDHTIQATAPDHQPWSKTVTVAGGASTARISVPTLEAAPQVATANPTPATAHGSPFESEPSPPQPEQASAGHMSGTRVAALITGGVGVAGLAAGGVLGALSLAKHNDGAGICADRVNCTPAGVSAWSDATNFGNAATIAFIAGGVLVATGVVLWVTAPRSGGTEQKAAELVVGPGSVGLVGTW